DLGSCGRKAVGVQLPPSAPYLLKSDNLHAHLRLVRGSRRSGAFDSVDLRFGDWCGTFEKIKVAPFVGLLDVLQKQFAVAPRIDAVLRPPRSSAPGQFLVAYAHIQLARGDVQLDDVAFLQQRERSTDKRFRRDMQDARAVACAAHARVGDAHHVAYARL